MKIWIGYGSEHSANLVIIGKFESDNDAEAALNLLNEATAIARADEAGGVLSPGEVTKTFSPAIMDLYQCTELSLNYGDPEELLYDYQAKRESNKVVITTDETDINAFIKVLLHHAAKIEIYSAHSHDSLYGRQTRT